MGFGEQIERLKRLKKAVEDLAPRGGDMSLVMPYKGWVNTLDKQIRRAQAWEGHKALSRMVKGGDKGAQAE